MTSFVKRDLRFTFTLSDNAGVGDGSYVREFPAGGNSLKVSGLRASVEMKAFGSPEMPTCELRIFGLKQSDMNALTALGIYPNGYTRNTVTVEAASGGGVPATIFSGQIYTAGPNYSSMPDVAFEVFARTLYFDSINPATPTRFTGPTDVVQVVQEIAAKMARVVENNGVEGVTLSNPYYAGTLTDQLTAVCADAGIGLFADPAFPVIAITPNKQSVRNIQRFVLSPANGLIGYPTLSSLGYAQARAIFNPAFRYGAPLRIEGSDVPRANGDWAIRVLSHKLESQVPGGSWFSDFQCWPSNTVQVA